MTDRSGVHTYTTELSKGLGAVPETIALLEHWSPGMNAEELARITIAEGLLGRATANRAWDLASRVFARRLLTDGGEPAARLRRLVDGGVDGAIVRQLLFLFTARAHRILRDFVTEVYWPRCRDGALRLGRDEADRFIEDATMAGRIDPPWSPPISQRAARDLTGTLSDFGLLEEKRASVRSVVAFPILLGTTLYLAHETHFAGFSDNSILDSPDWQLFGLERADVVRELERAAQRGHFIVQNAGDLLRVGWRYRTMEECLDAIARG